MRQYDNLFSRPDTNNVAYTHDGNFHLDDVCCAALLKYVFPSIKIRRVSELPETALLAFDIGGGKYDHHKPNPKQRPNGVVYSSFGLLWNDIGSLVIPERYTTEFDIFFVSRVDYADTTGKASQLSSTIRAMNPWWNSTISFDEAFEDAVNFITGILKTHFTQYMSREEGYHEVERLAKDRKNMIGKHTLILPKYIPYRYGIDKEKIWYVVFPLDRGVDRWSIHLTNCTKNPVKQRWQRFPLEWDSVRPPGTLFLKPDRHIVLRSKVDMLYCVKQLEEAAL